MVSSTLRAVPTSPPGGDYFVAFFKVIDFVLDFLLPLGLRTDDKQVEYQKQGYQEEKRFEARRLAQDFRLIRINRSWF